MLYLVIEILVYVILAGLLGLACGWLLRGGGVRAQRRDRAALLAEIDNKNEALYQVRGQLAAARDQLRRYAGEAAATDSQLAAVIDGSYRVAGPGAEAGRPPRSVAALRTRLARIPPPAGRRAHRAGRARRRRSVRSAVS